MLFRLHFLLYCIFVSYNQFLFFSCILYYVACAFVIYLIKYLLTYFTYFIFHWYRYLVPVKVKGQLPCDWREQTLWSVCAWQVKLCDPLVTHGPCLTSRCCPAWQLIRPIIAVLHDSLLCGWAVWLDYNKCSLLLLLLLLLFIPRVV